MKKLILAAFIALASAFGASAQKFALVDMDYILSNVPSYEMANEQLNQLSQRWQKEVEAVAKEAENLYKNYQNEMVFLTDEQKKKKEAEIVAKEKSAAELRAPQEAPDTHEADTGRRIQRRQESVGRTRLPVYLRPRNHRRYHLCITTNRCLQRGA